MRMQWNRSFVRPSMVLLTLAVSAAAAEPATPASAPAQPTAGQEKIPAPHPLVRQRFVPADIDWEHPVYSTDFSDDRALADWKLEGGHRMSIRDGKLLLENKSDNPTPSPSQGHLVCWLAKEMPADFLLEFKLRPHDRKTGLAIVFFNARGLAGQSIFDPGLAPRDGTFSQYHSGDLNNYHVSYWAGSRPTAHIRKNKGFALVAAGPDLVAAAPAEAFQTIRIYKRGALIRVMVDDVVSVAFDDDGKTYGPVWTHSGWIGLRQMEHTIRCEYDDLHVWRLK